MSRRIESQVKTFAAHVRTQFLANQFLAALNLAPVTAVPQGPKTIHLSIRARASTFKSRLKKAGWCISDLKIIDDGKVSITLKHSSLHGAVVVIDTFKNVGRNKAYLIQH